MTNTAHRSKKWGQKSKSKPKEIKLWFCHHLIRLEKTSNHEKECQNQMKLCTLEGRVPKSQLAFFTLGLLGKTIFKSIRLNFRGLRNEKSGFIFEQEIYLCRSCKNNNGKISIIAEVIRPNVRHTMEKTRFEIWPF